MGFLRRTTSWAAGLVASLIPIRHERHLVYRDQHDVFGMDAGRMSRLDADFSPAMLGPNATAENYLDLARRRSTSLIENNPIISGAVETLINNVVGPQGIYPQPDTGDREIDKQLSAMWWRVSEGCDPSRTMDIVESQWEAVAEYARVGEWLAHYPVAPAFNGFEAGPAIEMIDTDRLPLTDAFSMYARKAPNGNIIRQSVEVDNYGRVVAYHVLKEHPSDNAVFGHPTETIRIPATQARLAIRRGKFRPGRLRGVPWAVAVMGTVRMEDSFQEAGLVAAKTAACVSVFATQTAGAPGQNTPGSAFTDADGQALKTIRPGLLGWFRGSGEIKVVGGNLPGPQFESAIGVQHRRVAAGLSMSASVLSRDYSKATFSATRAESLEDRKTWRSIQKMVWLHHTAPFYHANVDWAKLSGRLVLTPEQVARIERGEIDLHGVKAVCPGWEWVNPQQEATAGETSLRSGISDPYTECAKQGQHAEDVIDNKLRAEKYELEKRKEMGLPPKAAVQPAVGNGMPGGTPPSQAPDESPDDSPDDTEEPDGSDQ